MAENIQVFVRCRPLKGEEKNSALEIIEDKREVKIVPHGRDFYFNQVFSSDAAQEEVYNSVVRPLINQVLSGFNCTVFAYGQTGTGKTYTMEGDRLADRVSCDGTGIIPRAVSQLFDVLRRKDIEFSIKVSFLEIYSEDAYDLLSSPDDTTKLRIFDDAQKKGSVKIDGLKEIVVDAETDIFSILGRGAAKRQTAATLLNACSSRSHSIFTITVDQGSITGKLNLVDLAGSENIGRSGAQDKHAREAGNINQSLLTLTRVITALVEKRPHIPYRESKLTRILQDSLGGTTRTSMIATISPAEDDLGNTIGTLDYASRARSITNRPETNRQLLQKKSSEDFNRELQALRDKHCAEICELEFKIRNEVAVEFRREMEKIKESIKEQHQEQMKASECRLSESNKQREQLATQVDELKAQIEQITREFKEQNEQLTREFKEQNEQLTKEFKEQNEQLNRDLKIATNLSEYRAELVKQIETDLKLSLLRKQELEKENLMLKERLEKLENHPHNNHNFINNNNNNNSHHQQRQHESPINHENHENDEDEDEDHENQEKVEIKKANKIRKRLPAQEDCNDYANMTFDGDDEIIQVSAKKARKKIAPGGKKRELYHPLTLSGRKKKLRSTEDDVVELSPVSPPVRVTRSRATRRKLDF